MSNNVRSTILFYTLRISFLVHKATMRQYEGDKMKGTGRVKGWVSWKTQSKKGKKTGNKEKQTIILYRKHVTLRRKK